MPKLKHYGILTAGEDSQAEYAGKYLIATELCCPFCETPITETQEDRRGVNTPFCGICGDFSFPCLEYTDRPEFGYSHILGGAFLTET